MGNSVDQHIEFLPESLKPGVRRWFERMTDQGNAIPDELGVSVARIIACSEFAGGVLQREFPWFIENVASFSTPADDMSMARFADTIATSNADIVAVKSELRRYRNRYLFRVLWREVHLHADLTETQQQLSLLADRLLDAATRYGTRQLEARFGQVRDSAGEAVPLIILGMGKLGGRELNFSSDIDVIFCYTQNGDSDGQRSISAQEYFTRLSRQIISLIDEVTVDGFVFRIDTRLRPFGDSGPPVVSFAALESYLLQHGRDWERYAYVKARIVGTEPPRKVSDELNSQLIRPFVYRRYLDYGVFESVREMQEMIATEVRRRELRDNVKLGPGGIREAEFIVQALQLVRGGSEPALQCRELQTVLPLLVSDRGISKTAADEITKAYRYLRRLENFIQAIRDQQTHDLPGNETDRERICLAMRYANWDDLTEDLNGHRKVISTQFAAIAFRDQDDESPRQQAISQLWTSDASEQQWADELRELCGDRAASMAKSMVAFAHLSVTQQVDSVSAGRLQTFIPKLLELVVASDKPDRALSRTLSIAERILRRSAYLALLNENQAVLSKLVDLCAQSQYIADRIARYPALLDELLDPRNHSEGVQKDELTAELRRRIDSNKSLDSESQVQVIAQYQRAAMFRIAVADFNDKLPIMKVSDALTWLAEVVLEEALRVAWNDMTARHGVPSYVVDGVQHEAGFGIIGYGKLGGLELSYGSDLDIVFLHDAKGENQITDGDKPLDNTMFFSRLVRRLVHFLTTQTGSGELYEVDTRLRPDGRSGLLVSSTDAFERYQEENAWTWEHQALLRARAVAGSTNIAREFERIRDETLTNRVDRNTLRDDVVGMRRRMRRELDHSDDALFDLKHGIGGMGDIEFLVQYLVLQEACSDPAVIVYSDNIRQLDALIAADFLELAVGQRLQDIYRHYRLQSHRLALDGQKALCDNLSLRSEREFVARVWQDWLG
jgi:glutamate-ammonia-ligase adenylyltransferase